MCEGTVCAGGATTSQAGGMQLVAGEETRSRKAWQHTQMPARHLKPFGAALRVCSPEKVGDTEDGEYHEPFAFGREYTVFEQRRSFVLNNRSLMEQNLPSHFRSLLQGRAPSDAYLILNQRIRTRKKH